MDEFFFQENLDVFKKWVCYQIQNDSRLSWEKYDERTLKIYYKNKVARFVMWPNGIIEEVIHEDDQLIFYLHYQLQNFHYAIDLFQRMIIQLTENHDILKHQILLCCTGGMTTGYFAEKMNKYCQLNQIPVQVSATAFYNLENVYQDYEMIFVAPQLRYKVMKLREKLKQVIVENIDPIVFATYDCQGLCKQIQKCYGEMENE